MRVATVSAHLPSVCAGSGPNAADRYAFPHQSSPVQLIGTNIVTRMRLVDIDVPVNAKNHVIAPR